MASAFRPRARSALSGVMRKVYREQIETGAMIVRMAPSHVRFGTFEIFYYRKQHDHLKVLADYVIEQHCPELMQHRISISDLFQEVVRRRPSSWSKWQAVGWAHGVLNTDNMSILGLTLDYGPYGFMDDYDAGFICNHSDHNGRYAFNQQPYIGLWNLSCFAQTLLPLAPKEELKRVLDAYMPAYTAQYQTSMRAKMGLIESQADDEALVHDLLSLLQGSRVDYTRFFRELGDFSPLTQPSSLKGKGEGSRHMLRDWFLDPARFDGWTARYGERLRDEDSRDEERRGNEPRESQIYPA